MKYYLFLCLLFLGSCAKHADGTSVWAGGLWLVPALFSIGVLIFGYKTIKGYQSGSEVMDNNKQSATYGQYVSDGKKMIPTGYLVFTIGCLIGLIGSIIWVISEK